MGDVGAVVSEVSGVGCVGWLVGPDGDGLVGSDGGVGSLVGVVGLDVVGCIGSVVGEVLGSLVDGSVGCAGSLVDGCVGSLDDVLGCDVGGDVSVVAPDSLVAEFVGIGEVKVLAEGADEPVDTGGSEDVGAVGILKSIATPGIVVRSGEGAGAGRRGRATAEDRELVVGAAARLRVRSGAIDSLARGALDAHVDVVVGALCVDEAVDRSVDDAVGEAVDGEAGESGALDGEFAAVVGSDDVAPLSSRTMTPAPTAAAIPARAAPATQVLTVPPAPGLPAASDPEPAAPDGSDSA